MCENVVDETYGHITEMRNVLNTMFTLYFSDEKEKLRKFCIDNKNTVNHIYFFHQALNEKGEKTDVKKIFEEIKEYLNVSISNE